AGPPEVRGAEDLQAANEWLRQERRRVGGYTPAPLARIQNEQQAPLQQNYLNDQAPILRSQELARRGEMLLVQGRAVQQQSAELSRRESALASRLAEWGAAQQDHPSTAQQQVVETLQSETVALQKAQQAAREELAGLLTAIEQQRESRAREEA